MLYIVATPIGNLEDITLRAIRTLKECDYIAAEDTRHVQILLNKYDIKKPCISFHAWSTERTARGRRNPASPVPERNNSRKLTELVQLLKEEKNIALVSDAGTPGISDPGYVLVKAAIENNIKIVPIPGPSAVITALCASGAPTHQFLYLGFLPMKKGRQTLLQTFINEQRTIIFYESPHRLLKTLQEFAEKFPDRPMVVARELTKIYEEFFRGTSQEALRHFQQKPIKGEFVIMLGG